MSSDSVNLTDQSVTIEELSKELAIVRAERDAALNECARLKLTLDARVATAVELLPQPHCRLPAIEIVPDGVLRRTRPVSWNRLCNMRDWEPGGALSQTMKDIDEVPTIHRKPWEYAICINGLRELGCVTENSTAIAVGAGYERPLFYFANHIKKVVATDLYDNPDHEGQPGMLTNPESFASIPYRKDHLEVYAMSALDLNFPDETFDFAFCLSSIEHFGSRDDIRRAFNEMIRVVKTGGKLCIITELILNNQTHYQCFTPDEIEDVFLRHPHAYPVGGDFDLRIAKSLYEYPIDVEDTEFIKVAPHIVIDIGGPVITSLSMFFEKH